MEDTRKYLHTVYIIMFLKMFILLVQPLDLDIERTQIFGSANQYRIQFFPRNGIPPYRFLYLDTPKDWFIGENYIFVNRPSSQIYQQFVVKFILVDRASQPYKKSLIFTINSQHMYLDSFLYSFQASEEELGVFQIHPEPIQDKNIFYLNEVMINSTLQSYGRKNPRLSLEFMNVASINDIETASENNDLLLIIKTISTVYASQRLNCYQRTQHLSEIEILLKKILDKKIREVKLRKNIESKKIDQKQKQGNSGQNPSKASYIDNVTLYQISKLRQENKNTRQKYFKDLTDLKDLYTELHSNLYLKEQRNRAMAAKNIEIDENSKKIQELTDSFNLYLIWYSGLEEQKKKTVKWQIMTQYGSQINRTQNKLINLRKSLKGDELYIKGIDNRYYSCKLNIKNLELSINRYQKDLKHNQMELLKLLQTYSKVIDNESLTTILRKRLSYQIQFGNDIAALDQDWINIQMFSDIIGFIQNITNLLYFQCFGIKKVNAFGSIKQSLYEMSYEDFSKYTTSLMRPSNNLQSQPPFIMQTDKTVKLQRASILNDAWGKKYGTMRQDIKSLYEGWNNCEPRNQIKGYKGFIYDIKTNIIEVRLKGERVFLLLNPCTRIDMSDPIEEQKKGRIIVWRAYQVRNKIFQPFQVLIF